MNKITFGDEISSIKENIIENISQYNAKQERDIIILIDFNIYNKNEKNISQKTSKIDSYVEETIIILNNYLSNDDRISVITYSNDYKIICPLMIIKEIDNENFSKDLIYCKNNSYNQNSELEELDYGFEIDNDIQFDLGGKNLSEHSG